MKNQICKLNKSIAVFQIVAFIFSQNVFGAEISMVNNQPVRVVPAEETNSASPSATPTVPATGFDAPAVQLAVVPSIIAEAKYMRDVQTSEGLRQIYFLSGTQTNSVVVYNPQTQKFNTYAVPSSYDPFLHNTTGNLDALTIPAQRDYAVLTSGSNGQIRILSLKDQTEPIQVISLRDAAQDGVLNLAWIDFGKAKIDTKLGRTYILTVPTNGQASLAEEMALPAGWTRATSNLNFAFKKEILGSTGKLHLMDLKTGQSQELISVYGGSGYPSYLDGVYDVTADGTTVIYGYSQTLYGGATIVQKIGDATQKLIIQGNGPNPAAGQFAPANIIFSGQTAVITLENGTVKTVDLKTLTVIPNLPAGWTRATSNPNFAFQSVNAIDPINRNNYTTLKIQNLTTGNIQTLKTLQSPPYRYTSMDVSSDGSIVYHSIVNDYGTDGTSLTVQKVAALDQKVVVPGRPYEVSFLANGNVAVVFRVDYSSGTIQIGDVYEINKTTLVSSFSHSKLLVQGGAILDEGYLIIPETTTYSNSYKVTLYDAKQGTDHMIKSPRSVSYYGGIGGYGGYTLKDVRVTEGGKEILSIGINSYNGPGTDTSKTFILDLATGKQLEIDGSATTVNYLAGDLAECTITHRNGTSEIKTVDLKMLAVIPNLPAGWTRAASSANYAYYQPSPGKLEVMNLNTGVKTLVYSASDYRQWADFVDVSSKGYVVYSITNSRSGTRALGVFNLNNSVSVMLPTGGYMSIKDVVFSATNISVAVNSYNPYDYPNGGVYKVNPTNGSIVFTPDLHGWIVAASNPNFAFQTAMKGTDKAQLKIMNLKTGDVRILVEVNAAAGLSISSIRDVSSDGKTVVYGYAQDNPKDFKTVIQDLSVPAKKLILSGKLEKIEFLAVNGNYGNSPYPGMLARVTYFSAGIKQQSIVDPWPMTELKSIFKKNNYTIQTNGYAYFVMIRSYVTVVPDRSVGHPDKLVDSAPYKTNIYFHFVYTPRGSVSGVDYYQAFNKKTKEWTYVTRKEFEEAKKFNTDGAVTGPTKNLSFKDVVAFASEKPSATKSLTKLGEGKYNLAFNVSNSGSYVGGIMTFDDYGTSEVETVDLSKRKWMSIGLKLKTGTGSVLLELEDINGKKDQVLLTGVGTTQKYWRVALSSFNNPSLDKAKIKGMNVVVVDSNMNVKVNALKVDLGKFPFTPSVGPNSTATAPTTSLSFKDVVAFASEKPSATKSLTKLGEGKYNLAFNVSNSGSYVGGIMTFDDYGTSEVEMLDLSRRKGIDIGLKLKTGTGSVLLELEDINGKKDQVLLTGVGTTQKYWRVALSSFNNPSLDKTKIKGMNVVVVDSNMNVKVNALKVDLGKFPFTPTVEA